MKHTISKFNQNAQILSSPENLEIPSLPHFLHFSKLYHALNLPLHVSDVPEGVAW